VARYETERTLFNVVALESNFAQARTFAVQGFEKRLTPISTLKLGKEHKLGAEDGSAFPGPGVMTSSYVPSATLGQIISEPPEDWQGELSLFCYFMVDGR
jgi:hypothetical protein